MGVFPRLRVGLVSDSATQSQTRRSPVQQGPRLDTEGAARVKCTITTSTNGATVAVWQINITTGSGTPIYRQIVDQVRLAVSTGALPAGHPMSSVRSLSERLVINPNTVAKAYGELVRDGVLESQQSLGFFVAEKRQVYSKAERLRRLRQAANTFVHEAIFLDFTEEEIRSAVDKSLAALQWGDATAGALV
jgi:GntR family transcriptional regulator